MIKIDNQNDNDNTFTTTSTINVVNIDKDKSIILLLLLLPASVAQLDAHPIGDQEVAGLTPPPPPRGQQHSFAEIDHEIFSTAILSLPLIQEGQLSVSGERMCTILVN